MSVSGAGLEIHALLLQRFATNEANDLNNTFNLGMIDLPS